MDWYDYFDVELDSMNWDYGEPEIMQSVRVEH